MKRLQKILAFLRLTDREDHLLSLTNLAVFVAIVKIAAARDVSVAELGTLLTALLAYQWKGHRRDKRESQKGASDEVLAELKTSIQTAQDTASKAQIAASRR